MATVNDLLIRARRRLGDMQKLKLSDPELIDALNDAIDALSGKLILEKEPEMIKTLTLTNTTAVARPSEFIAFVGQYPVQFITDAQGAVTIKHLDSAFSGTLEVRYFAAKNKIAALSDTVPFSRIAHQTMLVDNTVSSFAQNAAAPKA